MTAIAIASPTAIGRSVAIHGTSYSLDLPSIRDARLHASFVVLTIHVLGQTVFGFRVSVPQIVSAILASALIEVVVTARRKRRIVWPASAILTGSGVGLILRVDDTGAWDHWTWHAWYLFAATAALSIATKYVLRHRGQQVFNPSNIGLLIVFLALGSSRVEPLDLWWHRWSVPVALAYVVIVGGGVLITKRLGLLGMAAAFWATLGAGSAVLGASRHCITTEWSLRPVCDGDFARLIATSPEILIFTFFMLTDPRTAPRTALRRVAFGATTGALSLLLLAPARTEFGTKVSLFAALAIVCVMRSIGSALAASERRAAMPRRFLASEIGGLATGASVPVLAGLVVLAVVQLGTPARSAFANVETAALEEPLDLLPDLAVPPPPKIVAVDAAALELDASLAGEEGRARVAGALVVALAAEHEALRRRDAAILATVDHGTRLSEMGALIERSAQDGKLTTVRYTLGDARLTAVRPGGQSGSMIGVEVRVTMTEQTIDAKGRIRAGPTSRGSRVFVLRPYHGTRWLLVDVREDASTR